MVLLCWWCCHPPTEPDKFLHMPFRQIVETKKYQTVGNFCSWECMKAYAIDKYKTHVSGVICMYIRFMRAERTILRSAPSRLCLREFGGTMTIEEFRKNSSNSVKAVLPEVDHKVYQIIEQPSVTTTRESSTSNDNRMKSIMSAQCENEPLRLKRNRPLKRENTNNLAHTLGIVKKNPPLAVRGP